MSIGIITAYSAIASFPWNIAVQAVLMFVMGGLSSLVWAICGSSLRRILTSPGAVRAFNILMALLLLASLYPVLMDA
jgi:threonine/homoserine/homoserine lactone efflux protein